MATVRKRYRELKAGSSLVGKSKRKLVVHSSADVPAPSQLQRLQQQESSERPADSGSSQNFKGKDERGGASSFNHANTVVFDADPADFDAFSRKREGEVVARPSGWSSIRGFHSAQGSPHGGTSRGLESDSENSSMFSAEMMHAHEHAIAKRDRQILRQLSLERDHEQGNLKRKMERTVLKKNLQTMQKLEKSQAEQEKALRSIEREVDDLKAKIEKALKTLSFHTLEASETRASRCEALQNAFESYCAGIEPIQEELLNLIPSIVEEKVADVMNRVNSICDDTRKEVDEMLEQQKVKEENSFSQEYARAWFRKLIGLPEPETPSQDMGEDIGLSARTEFGGDEGEGDMEMENSSGHQSQRSLERLDSFRESHFGSRSGKSFASIESDASLVDHISFHQCWTSLVFLLKFGFRFFVLSTIISFILINFLYPNEEENV